MNKPTSIFQKFVFITAIFNFPIGLGMIAQALYTPNPDTLSISVVLGAFIIFAGAALMWASTNLQSRAPLVVWNGLVRIVGFASVLFTASIGTVPLAFIAIGGMDSILALVYIIGSGKAIGIPFSKLIFGKTDK